jgi:CPA2 family monovalent cation:H+ antiporter-2
LHILQDIVVILFSSIVIIFICNALKIPSIVGFILTGIIIGPYSASFIGRVEDIEALAEIGVALMLFIVGIEFSIKKLIRIKRLIFLAGGGQVLLTIAVVMAVSFILGYDISSSLLFGFLVSLSSTAIVLKLLQDKKQIDTPHGKIGLGILLFQDLCVAPMIILVPLLATSSAGKTSDVIVSVVLSFVVIGLIFVLAKFVMPYMIKLIVGTRLKEMFVMASLFLCLGMAYLTSELGLSLALGAFVAGIIISESRYSHQVIADVMPFKELFNGLFFISIGMLLNLKYVSTNLSSVFLLGFGIFALKALIVFFLTIFFKYPLRVSVMSAMGLAQIGEFSFVIAKLGLNYELISDELFQAFLSASIITMIFTPFAFVISPGAARKLEQGKLLRPLARRDKHAEKDTRYPEDKLHKHAIIVGYGLNGKNLARALKRRKIPYVIVELNPENVIEAERNNEFVVYGDATKDVILLEAGIKNAKTITFAISDPLVIDHAVSNARLLNDKIYIIARTKYVSEIDKLYELGANTVFAEEYETSIEIIARVLALYGISKDTISREIRELHDERYEKFRDRKQESSIEDRIHQVIHEEIDIESFTVSEKCGCDNRSISELNIRSLSGATIISVIRGKESYPNPSSDFIIKPGDVILLLGRREQVEKAIEILR